MEPMQQAWMAAAIAAILFGGLAPHASGQNGYAWDRDILYRPADEAEADAYINEMCRLDVYYPENEENFITVVWLHPGGLKMGERYVPGELRGEGFAIVAVDYRLNPEVNAPAYIEDAAAATAWVFENIERYGGSRDKIIVAGFSAGAYLSMMIGLDPQYLTAHDINPDDLLGIASLSGQCITHVAVKEERGIDHTQILVDEMAPLFHARNDAPPLLLVTGGRDLELLGRYEENALMARAMQLEGHTATELYELEGFDHGGQEKPAHGLLLQFVKKLEQTGEDDR